LLSAEVLSKLIVVDNTPDDPKLEVSITPHPDVHLIRATENLGFSKGNNLGIKWALENTECEFIFLLNNDATVVADTISKLENAMDLHPEAGIVSPRILLEEHPEELWYGGGDVNWKKGAARVPGYRGKANSETALTPRYVNFASGCAMLVRTSTFYSVGGLDPRFFMYEEDLELCFRVKDAGWKIRYIPEALVFHKGQGSQRKENEYDKFISVESPENPRLVFMVYHLTRNRLLNMWLHARGINAFKFSMGFPIYCTARCLSYLSHGRWDAVCAMYRGAMDFVACCRQPYRDELQG